MGCYAGLLKGVRKSQPDKKVLAPITLPILTKLLDSIPYLQLNNYNSSMLKALFLLAYHGCLRVGELLKSTNPQHAILFHNIKYISDTDSLSFCLESYKHSLKPVTFIIAPYPIKEYCPVTAFTDYAS